MLKLKFEGKTIATFGITTLKEADRFVLSFEEKTNDEFVNRQWIFERNGEKLTPAGIGWEILE